LGGGLLVSLGPATITTTQKFIKKSTKLRRDIKIADSMRGGKDLSGKSRPFDTMRKSTGEKQMAFGGGRRRTALGQPYNIPLDQKGTQRGGYSMNEVPV